VTEYAAASGRGATGEARAAPAVAPREPRRWPPLAVYLAAAVCLAGVLLRVHHYAARRSLWLDEALLSVNVASRSFGELFSPLDYGQAAPLLFLWAERAMVRLAGVNELALRALPFAAGVALIPLTWVVASRLMPRAGAALAAAMVALSPLLVYYANEVKPYSGDALVTVLLLWAALDVLRRPAHTPAWWRLWAGGALAVWASSPSVFVLASVGLALLVSPAVRGLPNAASRIAATAAAWGASFGVAYFTFYRATANNAYMQRFWEGTFLTNDPPGLVVRAGRAVNGVVVPSLFSRDLYSARFPALFTAAALVALLLCTAGLVAVARRREVSAAILLAGPIAAALAASTVRLYPVAERLMTYAAPLLALMAAAGAAWIAAGTPRRWRTPGLAAAAALFLAPSGYSAASHLRTAERDESSRPVIAELRRLRDPAEPLYVFTRSISQWMFYGTDWDAPDHAHLRYAASIARPPAGPAFYNKERRRQPITREGDTLRYAARMGPELYGISSGNDNTAIGDGDRPPVAGWAANEARRIRAAASPCIWMLLAAYNSKERRALLAEVAAAGGQTRYSIRAGRAQAIHLCFATDRRNVL